MNENIEEVKIKSKKSLKWSTFGEVIGRLITPLTTAILSRILAPEIFGIVTTITIVISFCEIFSEGGFAKYIIQSDFADENEKNKSLNVAFWSNFCLSIILFALICIFNRQVAGFVGSSGYELALVVACVQVPIYSINGTLAAVFRREFKFQKLFYIRIITALINLCVSVPLALLGFSYWSIIIGNISSMVISTIVLFVMSDWYPSFYFNSKIFKNMFSFSSLNLLEALIIWLCSWASSLIISNKMDAYYLGIYKNATSMVNSLFGIITSSIIPVLFSSLSRLKNSEEEFNRMYYKMQSLTAFILLPMGIGLFIYRDLATLILFGSKWTEASIVIGMYCLTKIFTIVISNFASEVYRSKGKPIVSIIAQVVYIGFLIPLCFYTVDKGFEIYVVVSSLVSLSLIITSFIFLKFFFKMQILSIFMNVLKPLIACVPMAIIAYALKYLFDFSQWFDVLSIIICVFVYFIMYYIFFRKDLKEKIGFMFGNKENGN